MKPRLELKRSHVVKIATKSDHVFVSYDVIDIYTGERVKLITQLMFAWGFKYTLFRAINKKNSEQEFRAKNNKAKLFQYSFNNKSSFLRS